MLVSWRGLLWIACDEGAWLLILEYFRVFSAVWVKIVILPSLLRLCAGVDFPSFPCVWAVILLPPRWNFVDLNLSECSGFFVYRM